MADMAEYDNFVTQFCGSLVDGSGKRYGNWFGRLIRWRAGQKWYIRNFFGRDYPEDEFRTRLSYLYDPQNPIPDNQYNPQGETIRITAFSFDANSIKYTPDPSDPAFVTVTVEVTITASINGGQPETRSATMTHRLKRAWQAYESRLD